MAAGPETLQSQNWMQGREMFELKRRSSGDIPALCRILFNKTHSIFSGYGTKMSCAALLSHDQAQWTCRGIAEVRRKFQSLEGIWLKTFRCHQKQNMNWIMNIKYYILCIILFEAILAERNPHAISVKKCSSYNINTSILLCKAFTCKKSTYKFTLH